ncbi:sugar ABC transporter substrate-binding protein [Dictyobacter arantiisoli]|uniref:Sugar ABC transporter substrate-binding protein n=1 Tax=Dictyobacter arantiisoli TaxID=2014874 RepID=A0A5A5TJR4_9CHLR|nr:substrate-binding domain-containing protein [Dictyobacter arantiisoli]GCF11478.1 sugar ABC transporter substrate-binding protein [Dictyobacter arantiisoli]
MKVGILLPDTTSSNRWEAYDHPLLVNAIQNALPGVHIDYSNAQASGSRQQQAADQDLANGDCILVLAPHDSVTAASIVEDAKAQHVPVIAYDRLVQSKDLNYYVSFDGEKVGELQAQYIKDHYQRYVPVNGSHNVIVVNGSQTDSNGLLFSIGMHAILDPLFASKQLIKTDEQFTPDWSSNSAQVEAEAMFSNVQDNVQIAYVANDSMAASVIAVAKAAKMEGKVLITGQDASVVGINNILNNSQSMTIYKPFKKEALSTAQLVKALHDGSDITTLTHNRTANTYDNGVIPSILDDPIVVDFNNVASTVIKDGYVTPKEVCFSPNVILPGTAGVC